MTRSLSVLGGALLVSISVSSTFAADHPTVAPPAGDAQAGAAASPPAPRRMKSVETIEQQEMNLAEMEKFFGGLDEGTALRLTYANGSEYAGNFQGKATDRPLIYCRKGLFARYDVPLENVVAAYVMLSSTHTVRIRRTDLEWASRP